MLNPNTATVFFKILSFSPWYVIPVNIARRENILSQFDGIYIYLTHLILIAFFIFTQDFYFPNVWKFSFQAIIDVKSTKISFPLLVSWFSNRICPCLAVDVLIWFVNLEISVIFFFYISVIISSAFSNNCNLSRLSEYIIAFAVTS